MEYLIIKTKNNSKELEKIVNERIKDGWKPIGSIYTINSNMGTYEIGQPMIKE